MAPRIRSRRGGVKTRGDGGSEGTPKHVLRVSATVAAPADRLYGIIADYRHGHPRILPRPPFVGLTVEEGGVGGGTVIRVETKLLGLRRTFRATVTEPEPGRRLVETSDTGYVTTFAVDPLGEELGSVVTISTILEGRRGLGAAIERRIASRMLRPVYARELELLAEVAGVTP